MSLDTVIVGLLMIGAGAAFAFAGFRLFLVALPIFGFVAGMLIGGSSMNILLGEGIFATVISWVVTVALGVGFALMSYFFWYGAVLVFAGSIGYGLGLGLVNWLGLGSDFIAFAAGIALAVLFVIGSVAFGLPRFIVIAASAISGAALVVSGGLVFLGQVPLRIIEHGPVAVVAEYGFVATAVWLALAVAGFLAQWTTGTVTSGGNAEIREIYEPNRDIPVRMSM